MSIILKDSELWEISSKSLELVVDMLEAMVSRVRASLGDLMACLSPNKSCSSSMAEKEFDLARKVRKEI